LISPIEEEPEGAGSLALSIPADGGAARQASQVSSSVEINSAPNIPFEEVARGGATGSSTDAQHAMPKRGLLKGAWMNGQSSVDIHVQASMDGSIAVNSPESLPSGTTRIWDSPTFGFGLQSSAPDTSLASNEVCTSWCKAWHIL
jgi:hypothetical protein